LAAFCLICDTFTKTGRNFCYSVYVYGKI